jgi:hypothetical protein
MCLEGVVAYESGREQADGSWLAAKKVGDTKSDSLSQYLSTALDQP